MDLNGHGPLKDGDTSARTIPHAKDIDSLSAPTKSVSTTRQTFDFSFAFAHIHSATHLAKREIETRQLLEVKCEWHSRCR